MENRLFLMQARPARTADESWLQDQIECLPTIARLAREGFLELFTYEELQMESCKRAGLPEQRRFGDVFKDTTVSWIPAAVRRGLFFQTNSSEHLRAEGLIEFCEWLVTDFHLSWLDAPYVQREITETEIRNLIEVERLRTICNPIARKHYGDAFHVWTGEVNQLPLFLTTDRKFIRAATQNGNRELPCNPLSPSALLEMLNVSDRDALPFEYGRRYLLSGQPYD